MDFTAGLSNCRLLPVSGVLLLFRPIQVASSGDQFPDTLLHLGPGKKDLHPVRLTVRTAPEFDPFPIIIHKKAAAGNGVGMSANAIRTSQKFNIFLLAFILLKLFKNTVFAPRYAASSA